MGGELSAQRAILSDEDIDALRATTPLRERDLNAIKARHADLMPGGDGRVSLARLITMPELAANPLGSRLCEVFSSAGDGSLDFIELVDLFASMCRKTPLDTKLAIAFRVFDLDGDGFIGRADVDQTLKLIVGEPAEDDDALVSPEDAATIVARVLAEGDFDGDEQISLPEFARLLRRVGDFATRFTVEICDV